MRSKKLSSTIVSAIRPRKQARQRGIQAENTAARFLAQQSVTVIARNIQWQRGEIDLIANDHGTLAFIEVRLRSHRNFGSAAVSITPQKQQRIIMTAQWWLQHDGRRYATMPCRFDALLFQHPEQMPEWLKNAFDSEGW